MASWSQSEAGSPALNCSSLTILLIPEHLQWLTGLQNQGQMPQCDSEPFPCRAPPHLSNIPHPSAPSTGSTCHSPNGLGLPCLEVASNLVRTVVVPWSKLPQWHTWKQILSSNPFSTYKYILVINILHEEVDLMTQFACTPCCSEKLGFQLFRSSLLLTFHN